MSQIDAALLGLLQVLGELWPLDADGQMLLLFSRDAASPVAKLEVLIAAQIGMVLGLFLVLHRELGSILHGLWKMLKGKSAPELAMLGKMIVVAFPAIVGMGIGLFWIPYFSTLTVVAVTIAAALLLLVADLMGVTVRRLEHLDWGTTGWFAIAQCLALVPGASRIGLMLTAARLSGYERPDAVKLSYLLSLPFWLALIPLELWSLWEVEPLVLSPERLQIAGGAFVVSLIAGWGLLLWMRHHTVLPFILWRLGVAGLALLVLL